MSFRACTREPADPSSTNLHARDITNDTLKSGGPYDVSRVPTGRMNLEHASDLVLTDGTIGAGNGYEAASAIAPQVPITRPGTVAPVTLAVLNSPRAGRRVAFLEVRLSATPPVRWDEDNRFGIGTDGGDGGFVTGAKDTGDDLVDLYVEAWFPGGNSASGNVCVLRTPRGGARPDAVLFSTGYGDGGYPTLVGRDANGVAVSLVSYGFVVPWRLSGLPGRPPQQVLDAEAKAQRG